MINETDHVGRFYLFNTCEKVFAWGPLNSNIVQQDNEDASGDAVLNAIWADYEKSLSNS